jgi:hypothetical protein
LSQEFAMNPFSSQPSPQTSSAHAWRERHMAPAWPVELLEPFCLRMSSQGMCVSRALMICDRRYALEQLSHAHNMADDTLRLMAVQLFRHFESSQSGIAGMH